MSKQENQAFQAILLHSVQRSSLSNQYDRWQISQASTVWNAWVE